MRNELITKTNRHSPVSETFNTLRTNIQFTCANKGLKTILITSSIPGEGKSWISANLAQSFANMDKKVLLIDADMRLGRLNKIFKTAQTPGLSDILSKQNNEKDISICIKQTENKNLFLIPTGSIPNNPSELLNSNTTFELFEDLKKYFDIIIVDAPPVLVVSDTLILAKIVDNIILVAEYNKTKKDDIVRAKKEIKNIGGNIIGTILNKDNFSKKRYSYY